MSKRFGAAQPQIKSYDPIWDQVRREAEETSANEPVLASVIYATILSEPTLEDAICHTVANRLQPSVDTGLLNKTFREVLATEPALGEVFRADLMAVAKRRAFVYQASEIYGGIRGFWDYGPLGAELKVTDKHMIKRGDVLFTAGENEVGAVHAVDGRALS